MLLYRSVAGSKTMSLLAKDRTQKGREGLSIYTFVSVSIKISVRLLFPSLFSSFCCFSVIMLRLLLLIVVISLLFFQYIPRVFVLMHLRNPQCWQILFFLLVTYYLFTSSFGCKALCRVITFIVIGFICLSCSLVHFKNGQHCLLLWELISCFFVWWNFWCRIWFPKVFSLLGSLFFSFSLMMSDSNISKYLLFSFLSKSSDAFLISLFCSFNCFSFSFFH